MFEHKYFEVTRTSMRIRKRGALAIHCSDAPKRDAATGTTTFSLRIPILLIPEDIFEDAEELAAKVARILNDHAAEFYSSAKGADNGQ
jgi:hypothetical protein